MCLNLEFTYQFINFLSLCTSQDDNCYNYAAYVFPPCVQDSRVQLDGSCALLKVHDSQQIVRFNNKHTFFPKISTINTKRFPSLLAVLMEFRDSDQTKTTFTSVNNEPPGWNTFLDGFLMNLEFPKDVLKKRVHQD